MKSLRYLNRSLPQHQACRRLFPTLQTLQNLQTLQQTLRLSTVSVPETLKRRNDYEELFLSNNVRYLLKRLTGFVPEVVFASKSLKNLDSPKYKFMTDEQLKIEKEAAAKRAEKLLQMPPLKYSSQPVPRILEKDPMMKGALENKLIFVDATPGYSDQERLIVVREIDGTLREATREERHRMNQAFYPVEERQMDMPKMFEPEHMGAVLERGAYKLLLENACLHFEPEDERFMEICHQVYDHISQMNAFDALYSTRYYGGMVYYYVFFKRVDRLLMHLLNIKRLDDIYRLLQLYYIVNPRPGSPEEFTGGERLSLTKLAQDSKRNRLRVPIERLLGLLKFYIDNDATDPQVRAVASQTFSEGPDHITNFLKNVKNDSTK